MHHQRLSHAPRGSATPPLGTVHATWHGSSLTTSVTFGPGCCEAHFLQVRACVPLIPSDLQFYPVSASCIALGTVRGWVANARCIHWLAWGYCW